MRSLTLTLSLSLCISSSLSLSLSLPLSLYFFHSLSLSSNLSVPLPFSLYLFHSLSLFLIHMNTVSLFSCAPLSISFSQILFLSFIHFCSIFHSYFVDGFLHGLLQADLAIWIEYKISVIVRPGRPGPCGDDLQSTDGSRWVTLISVKTFFVL